MPSCSAMSGADWPARAVAGAEVPLGVGAAGLGGRGLPVFEAPADGLAATGCRAPRNGGFGAFAGEGFGAAFFNRTSATTETAGQRDGRRTWWGNPPCAPGRGIDVRCTVSLDGASCALSHVPRARRVPGAPAARGRRRLTRRDPGDTTDGRQEFSPSSESDSFPKAGQSCWTGRRTSSRLRHRATSSWNSRARGRPRAGSAACEW